MLRETKVKNRGPKPPDQSWIVVGRLDESLRSFKRFGSPGSRPDRSEPTKTKSGLENPKSRAFLGMAIAMDRDRQIQ
jgi:hypothetical protein